MFKVFVYENIILLQKENFIEDILKMPVISQN